MAKVRDLDLVKMFHVGDRVSVSCEMGADGTAVIANNSAFEISDTHYDGRNLWFADGGDNEYEIRDLDTFDIEKNEGEFQLLPRDRSFIMTIYFVA